MFSSFYANLDAVEYLCASDASAQLVDGKGRSCMHYAAINDNAQLIETLFLHAKANPSPMKAAADFADSEVQIVDNTALEGNLDERYHDMEQQMNLIDTLFVEQQANEDNLADQERIPTKKQVIKGIMNYRDHMGRTPLHMAIAFNNKVAAETLLCLGANPHVKDAYGQRAIDNCYVESLRGMLEIKMANT